MLETLVGLNVNAGVNQLKQVLASQYLPKMPKQPILSTIGAYTVKTSQLQ